MQVRQSVAGFFIYLYTYMHYASAYAIPLILYLNNLLVCIFYWINTISKYWNEWTQWTDTVWYWEDYQYAELWKHHSFLCLGAFVC